MTAQLSLDNITVSFFRHTMPDIPSVPPTTDIGENAGERHYALRDVSWTITRGEHWAVIGPNGAGKSTLLRVIRGEQRADAAPGKGPSGGVTWYVDGKAETSPLAIRQRISTVTAEMQEHYVRQQWRMTGEEVLLSGLFDSPMLYQTPSSAQREAAWALAAQLDVTPLLDMQLPAMSQGQLRKVLVARALVAHPDIVVLDEMCEGLDAPSRAGVLETIQRATQFGATLLFATHRLEELPACITHALLLRGGTVLWQGPADNAVTVAAHEGLYVPSRHSTGDAPRQTIGPSIPNGHADGNNAQFAALEPPLRKHRPDDPSAESPAEHNQQAQNSRERSSLLPLIEIQNATVYLDRTPVLHDITWSVQPGQNWAVSGTNGSGKSTLLRLIMGDERQAWGGTVRWFGESTPDLNAVRRRIGYVSDRFQATYGHDKYHGTLLNMTGEELVWSGFSASVGLWEWQQVTQAQRDTAANWMHYLGLADFARQPIRDMSYGRLRRFMLCRAVAPEPDILLLDEPCSGLDPAARDHFLITLRQLVHAGMQLVYVSHYAEEYIPEITHLLRLSAGRVTYCGERETAPLLTTP